MHLITKMETYATHSILAKTQQKTEADWTGLDSARFNVALDTF